MVGIFCVLMVVGGGTVYNSPYQKLLIGIKGRKA